VHCTASNIARITAARDLRLHHDPALQAMMDRVFHDGL